MDTRLDGFKRVIGGRWTDILLCMGGGFIGLGIVVWILSVAFSSLNLLAVALGLMSMALGFIAIAMGRKSDARMKAMANLEFDEKIAVMTGYAEPAMSWESILYDTRAALRLARWANKSMKREFKRAFKRVVKQAKSDKDARLGKGLKDLWREYYIGKW